MRVYVVSDLAVWIWRVGSVRFSPRSRAIGLRPAGSWSCLVVVSCSSFVICDLSFLSVTAYGVFLSSRLGKSWLLSSSVVRQ